MELGKVILVSDLQSLKARIPMVEMEFGKVMLVSDEQQLKA